MHKIALYYLHIDYNSHYIAGWLPNHFPLYKLEYLHNYNDAEGKGCKQPPFPYGYRGHSEEILHHRYVHRPYMKPLGCNNSPHQQIIPAYRDPECRYPFRPAVEKMKILEILLYFFIIYM